MERASQSLAHMDYLTCEAFCLEALAIARQEQDWAYYARILLPLQEARRQRRMIAADGVVRLGTARLEQPVESWMVNLQAGCVVLTHPHKASDAQKLDHEARRLRRCVEVLFADNTEGSEAWTLRSYRGPAVSCLVPAPPRAWQDSWLAPGERPSTNEEDRDNDDVELASTPADWFIDATEALGDAALEQVTAAQGDSHRIAQLEAMLDVVTDHEILHQQLGDAARAMRTISDSDSE